MTLQLIKLDEQEGEVRAVPRASSVKATYCPDPSCPHIHLLLCTPDDRAYTMAVLSYEQIEQIAYLASGLKMRKERNDL